MFRHRHTSRVSDEFPLNLNPLSNNILLDVVKLNSLKFSEGARARASKSLTVVLTFDSTWGTLNSIPSPIQINPIQIYIQIVVLRRCSMHPCCFHLRLCLLYAPLLLPPAPVLTLCTPAASTCACACSMHPCCFHLRLCLLYAPLLLPPAPFRLLAMATQSSSSSSGAKLPPPSVR